MAHDLSVKAGNLIDPSPSMLADMVPPPGSEDRPAPDSDNGIHVVTAEELPQVAQSLAEAFEHDPHFSYMIRDEDKKLSRLGHGILSFIKHEWLPNGVVHTNEQRSGAAAWTDQGNWKASLATMARIAKSLIGVITPAEAARLRRVLDFTEDKHGEIEHRWRLHRYLAMVGLSPDWQGMGWGDALMKVVLDECDAKGEAAYLEASTPQSIPLYERNGFEVIAWGRYMGATEDLHFMWREPQPE
ncbi:MAG TPA: GNAT family N-acetyltransferase [Candidatus Saccharimonadales bacterium]|nr:GNAT family N-acetyltransferase [Candidatus Saccharimonadales bacterium]